MNMHVGGEAAAKFKVGDRVRYEDNIVEGVGIVRKVVDGAYVEVEEKDRDRAYFGPDGENSPYSGTCRFFEFDDLESAPRFNVGDRVRLVKDGKSTTGAVGKLATIDSWDGRLMDGDDYLLKIDPPYNDYDTLAVTREYTRATADCFEPVSEPAPPTIQAGRYYKTRDGRKVGPAVELNGEHAPFLVDNWYYDEDGTCRALGGNNSRDLVAEWPSDTGCAAAEVDNLRDEYGPFTAKPKFKVGDVVDYITFSGEPSDYWSNSTVTGIRETAGETLYDISDPSMGNGALYEHQMRLVTDATSGKFKVGDRVRITNPANFRTGTRVGDIGVVTKDYTGGMFVDIDLHHETDGVINQIAKPTDIKMAPSPAIVARIDNGQPKPAINPYVHTDRDSALREAARLAKTNPGKEFGVYEYVFSAKEAKVYEHEWQRLAAEGDRDGAATELHRLTGMRHSTARYVADTYA